MGDYAIIQERNAEFMRALMQILSICDAIFSARLRGWQDLIEQLDGLWQIRSIILDLFAALDDISNDAEIEDDAQIAGNATQLQN